MSKAVKLSLIILAVLIVMLAVFSFITLTEKQEIEQVNTQLQSQLQKVKKDKKQSDDKAQKLSKDLNRVNEASSKLKKQLDKAVEKTGSLTKEVKSLSDQRDKWESRVGKVSKEKDRLQKRVKHLDMALVKVKKEQELQSMETKGSNMVEPKKMQEVTRNSYDSNDGKRDHEDYDPPGAVDEEYWADLLTQKAALEVEVERLEREVSGRSVEMVEVRQENDSLAIELKTIKAEYDELEEELKYRTDVINNISLELARTKNDKKFVSNQVGKLRDENGSLRRELKSLVSSKAALEKSIMRLTQEKENVSRKLIENENLIQSKIDEIWEVKESLDRTFKSTRLNPQQQNIELPPIVVNSDGQAINFNTGMSNPGFNGKVVSVNEENNFVIVNLGEKTGIKLSDVLSVYRESKYIARLEVIQVRKDISAADIKDQWSKIQVGDIIR